MSRSLDESRNGYPALQPYRGIHPNRKSDCSSAKGGGRARRRCRIGFILSDRTILCCVVARGRALYWHPPLTGHEMEERSENSSNIAKLRDAERRAEAARSSAERKEWKAIAEDYRKRSEHGEQLKLDL